MYGRPRVAGNPQECRLSAGSSLHQRTTAGTRSSRMHFRFAGVVFFNCHRHSKFRDISNNCEDHLSQAIPQTRSNCKFATDVSDVTGTMCTEDHASQAIPRNRFQSKNAGCLRAVPRPAPIESLQRKPVMGTMCTEGHALQAIPRTRFQSKYAGCLRTCPKDKYAKYDRKL